jgi:hypothetical protein
MASIGGASISYRYQAEAGNVAPAQRKLRKISEEATEHELSLRFHRHDGGPPFSARAMHVRATARRCVRGRRGDTSISVSLIELKELTRFLYQANAPSVAGGTAGSSVGSDGCGSSAGGRTMGGVSRQLLRLGSGRGALFGAAAGPAEASGAGADVGKSGLHGGGAGGPAGSRTDRPIQRLAATDGCRDRSIVKDEDVTPKSHQSPSKATIEPLPVNWC